MPHIFNYLASHFVHLQAFSGRDASQAFISYHRRHFPHNHVKDAFVAVAETVDYTREDHSDFMELCERVNKVLPTLKSFAPFHYYVKISFLICTLILMEMYCHYNINYNFIMGCVLGLHMAITGEVKHISNFDKKLSFPFTTSAECSP